MVIKAANNKLLKISGKEKIMPGRNRTDPDGVGSLTGRRMGNYASGNQLEYNLAPGGYGRNSGRSFGRGRCLGFRRGFGPASEINFSDTPGKDDLENEITILKQRLAELDRQLSKTKKDD